MKLCMTCKQFKPESQFSVQKTEKDGLRYKCKQCDHDRYIERRDNKVKLCAKCQQYKPEDQFNKKKGGLHPHCKQCRHEYYIRRVISKSQQFGPCPPEKRKAKACSRCGVIKMMHDFSRNRSNPDKREYACKQCISGDVGSTKQAYKEESYQTRPDHEEYVQRQIAIHEKQIAAIKANGLKITAEYYEVEHILEKCRV